MESKSKIYLKIDLICRVCLLESNNLVSLFDQVNCAQDNLLSICSLLQNITTKEISTYTKYPRTICNLCLKNAVIAFNFKQQVEKSEEMLESYAKNLPKNDDAEANTEEFQCTVCERKCDVEEGHICSECNEINEAEEESEYEPGNNESNDEDQEENNETKEGESDTHMCAVCDEKFSSWDELKVHIVVHTKQKFVGREQGKPQVPNVEKNKVTEDENKMKMKRMRHPYTLDENKEKVYTCPICKKEYHRRFAFTSHLRLHTNEPSHLCYMCGKGFHTSGSLSRHMLTHTDLRPYACKMCPKRYKQLIGLKSHMRGHTGERPYLCSVCGKGFKQNSELKCHTRYHTQEKPYECNVCGKRTAMQSHMKQHMRSHTGEKPYVCGVCGKRFGDSGSVKQHVMAHSGVKPYKCNICNKAFGRSNSLRSHYKVHNKNKQATNT